MVLRSFVRNFCSKQKFRPYIDEYAFYKTNPNSFRHIVKEDKTRSDYFFQQLNNQLYTETKNKSLNRQDTRVDELPEKIGDYMYFGRHTSFPGDVGEYQLVVRKDKNNNEEIVLDLMKVPVVDRFRKTARLVDMSLADDNTLLAFGIDLRGDERTLWQIKSTTSNKPLLDKLYDVSSLKFTACNKYVVYTQMDDRFRPYQIKLHKIGTSQEEDKVLYEEHDLEYQMEIQLTKDKKYFVILCSSKTATKIQVFRREDVFATKKKVIVSAEQNCLAFIQHVEDKFYLLTNKDVYDYKVQVMPDEGSYFVDFYLPEEGEVIQEIDMFEKYLVLYIKRQSSSYLKVVTLENGQVDVVKVPAKFIYRSKIPKGSEVISTISPGMNSEYNQTKLRFHLDTPLVYDQVYELDLETKTLKKLEDSTLRGKPFNRDDYITRQVEYPSEDGELIPLSLVYHKDLKLNRQNKLILMSYGAYGIAQDVPFNVVHLGSLEDGWILAFAHIRGGNEKGHAWHQAATKQNKIVAVKDLISCANFLIAEGYTHPSLLCAVAGSAGATNLATAINMRPDLWKAVVLNVPFLDVIGSLTDESQPLTQSDFQEFGNPIKEEKDFLNLLSYSPYENILETVYPAIYVKAGEDDFRAPLWNVMKYVSRFRDRAKKSKKVKDVLSKGILVDVEPGGHSRPNLQIEDWVKFRVFFEYFCTVGNEEIEHKEDD